VEFATGTSGGILILWNSENSIATNKTLTVHLQLENSEFCVWTTNVTLVSERDDFFEEIKTNPTHDCWALGFCWRFQHSQIQ
jgi:hypothetical protein